MIQTTCLILEPSDFTSDENLRKEAFDAFAKAPVVIHNGLVIKTGVNLVSQALQQAAPLRVRKAKVQTVIVEPVAPAPNEHA